MPRVANRRDFLKGAAASLAGASTTWAQSGTPVSLVIDPNDAVAMSAPVQWAANFALSSFAISILGVLENVGIYSDDAVQAPVVEGDAHQILDDKFARSDASLFHGILQLRNRRFHDVKRSLFAGHLVSAGSGLPLRAQIYGGRHH